MSTVETARMRSSLQVQTESNSTPDDWIGNMHTLGYVKKM